MIDFDDDDFDDDPFEPPDPEPIDLGPCCCCHATGPSVRNILMLQRRAPVPGKGWGCLVCGLPSDGASAVLCDRCVDAGREPTEAIDGWLAHKRRVPIASLPEGVFDHDFSRHPEHAPCP